MTPLKISRYKMYVYEKNNDTFMIVYRAVWHHKGKKYEVSENTELKVTLTLTKWLRDNNIEVAYE